MVRGWKVSRCKPKFADYVLYYRPKIPIAVIEARDNNHSIGDGMQQGLLLVALAEDVGKDFGPFDLICHVAFDQPPLTRRARAENVRYRDYFTQYG